MEKEDKIVLSRLLDNLAIETANWGDESLPTDLFRNLTDDFKKNFSRRLISYLYGEQELKEYSNEVLDNPNNRISEVLSMYAELVKDN